MRNNDGAGHPRDPLIAPPPVENETDGAPVSRKSVLPRDGEGDTSTLRAALHTRDDLLAVVSHDMNNALHSIRLAAEVLARSATLRQDGATSRATDTIVRIVDRLHFLTRDLTDLALLEGGRLTIATAPFEPGEVVEAAVAELLPVATEKGVHLNITRPDRVVFGRGDRRRLLQILTNLGGNAVKFAPAGTTVLIGASVEAKRFRFFVSDEGPGIPESLRERVFRAGVRAAPSSGGGAGLGLAIAKTVVELMGGTIGVEGVEPRGARFSFEIPRFVDVA